MRYLSKPATSPADPVSEVVARLWQTTLRNISLIEDWLPQVEDFGIRAGLQAHLAEERRHQRLYGAEISRRNSVQSAVLAGAALDAPFAIVRDQIDDLLRVELFHLGIKAATVLYSARIIPLVESSLARVIEQVTRDEARHIRWAEIRLASQLDGDSSSRSGTAMREIEAAMESVWLPSWHRLSQARYGLDRTG